MNVTEIDIMEHKEYVRISNKSNAAFLFIHGILGTPNHFNDFVSLIHDSFSVYNMLLDGHGKGVKDFSRTSMKKWESQVASAVEELSQTHECIYIVAHSLGTLLAIEQAVQNKHIKGLLLLAVPLKLSLKRKLLSNSFKVYTDRVCDGDYEALAAKKCYGIGADKNPLHYIGWIPRFVELFAKIRKTRKLIDSITCSCCVFQSSRDEMVSVKSERYFRNNSRISLRFLDNSGHYYYDVSDFELLIAEFKKMVGNEACNAKRI